MAQRTGTGDEGAGSCARDQREVLAGDLARLWGCNVLGCISEGEGDREGEKKCTRDAL